jgi:glycerophosphoryl diester phosphodiesterase
MTQRLFARPIAHRGLHARDAGVIENSRAAFEAAIAQGYAIECDVQLSRDGVPFIFHDDALERLTGARGPAGDLPMAALQQLVLAGSAAGDTPQTLADFLAQIAGRTQLQIEIKAQPDRARTDALAAAVARALAAYGGPHTLESFDPAALVALRRHGVAAPLGIVTQADGSHGPRGWQRLVRRHLLHWPWTRFAFISCHNVALWLPAVRVLRACGVEVTAWTIRSEAEARAALRQADQIVFEGFRP